MLGRQRQRLAQAQFERFQQARLAGIALGLVGGKDHPRRRLAQDLREDPVGRRHPGAGVDQEQRDVGQPHRPLGQPPHPALQAVVGHLLQPGGVDHGERQVAQPRLALAQVAGHPGLIVDQRQPAADKAVEQRRLADIGAADDGKGKGHLSGSGVVKPPRYTDPGSAESVQVARRSVTT